MTIDEALRFLERHQPMPPDFLLTEELITVYDEVRKLFLVNPDRRCIPLLLQSFGDGSGFGVYQLVDGVIRVFPPEIVIPDLIKALRSSNYGVRYWCAEIAADFPDDALIPELARALSDPDRDLRSAALLALEQIRGPEVENVLRDALIHETDEELRPAMRAALGLPFQTSSLGCSAQPSR